MTYFRDLLDNQPELKQRITAFVAKVHDAWGALPYPGDDNIVPKTNYLDDDHEQALAAFKGKRWQDITLETLLANRSASWFTYDAFRYYIGVYMIATLTHFDIVDVLSDNTFNSLTPPYPDNFVPHWTDYWATPDLIKSLRKWFLEQASKFDATQRAVILEFVTIYALMAFHPDEDWHEEKLTGAIEFWSHPEFEKMIADKLKADG